MSTLRIAAIVLVGVGCIGLFFEDTLAIADTIKWASALGLVALIADLFVAKKSTNTL